MPKRLAFPLLMILATGGLILGDRISNRLHPSGDAASVAAPASARTIPFDLPPFALSDQDGRTTTNRDLLGRPWVVDFIYPECGECAALSRRVVDLQHATELAGVGFASFSVDPEDGAASLGRYVRRNYPTADEHRWRLLVADRDGFPTLVVGMGLAGNEAEVRRGFVAVSPYLYLVDAAGHVRGKYDAEDDAAVNRLTADAARLTGDVPGPGGSR